MVLNAAGSRAAACAVGHSSDAPMQQVPHMTDEIHDTEDSPEIESRASGKAAPWVIAAVAVAAVALIGLGVWWWQLQRSPTAALGKAAKAAMSRDVEGVEAAVDTTALVEGAVEDMYNDPRLRASYIDSYTAKHPEATPEHVKKRVGAFVNEEVREHVKSGTLPKRVPIPGDSLKGLVAEAYARHSVKSVTVKGSYAYATVAVPYHGKTYNVIVRLRRSNGTWVVDRVENLAQIMKQAGY